MKLNRSLRSLPLNQVRITDAFWVRYLEQLRDVNLIDQHKKLEETGRIENFRRVARGEKGTHEGQRYNDSDVYKWVEAACALRASGFGSELLDSLTNDVVRCIAGAQAEDGYIFTALQLGDMDLRYRNLHWAHELYCMGHLIEAAVAHRLAYGNDDLASVAGRVVEHLLQTFSGKVRSCGHPELELALMRWAPEDERVKKFVRDMIESRGQKPSYFAAEFDDPESIAWGHSRGLLFPEGQYDGTYLQDETPLRAQREPVGHAVRQIYLLSGAVDAYSGRDDAEIEGALEAIWESLIHRRMYVTGGVGSLASNEGFTRDYDLPNESAYAETCAACALVGLAMRLSQSTGEAAYMDTAETALYNGVICGVSESGTQFFYANPLESRGNVSRRDWFNCACCPPNLARTVASLGSIAAATDGDGLVIWLPISMEIEHAGAQFTVESELPWGGRVTIRGRSEKPVQVAIRIPEWCENTLASEEMSFEDGCMVIERTWDPAKPLEIEFELEPTWVASHPRVLDNLGKIALRRGPLVYCLEEVDLGEPPQSFRVDLSQEPTVDGEAIEVPGLVIARDESPDLYAGLGELRVDFCTARFTPYHRWGNRGLGAMQVWVSATVTETSEDDD